jgi:hypothetical protein
MRTALAALLLLGALDAARAQDLNLSGMNTLRWGTGTAWDDIGREDVDRRFLEETLDLTLQRGVFRLNLATQAAWPAEFPDSPPRRGDDDIRDVDLVRRTLEWQGPVNVQVGDVWTTFGNGLALSLFRDETLVNPRLIGNTREELPAFWDNGADGALVEALHGDWTVKALWGNTDYVGTLAAGNLEWTRSWGSLGGSLVRATAVPQNDDIRLGALPELDLVSREIYGTLRLGPADLSLNHVDQLQLDHETRNAGSGGVATYATASAPLLGWTVLAEYKYYRFARQSLYLNAPPIVQREIPTRLIARSTHRLFANENETGLLVDLSRGFAGGHTLRGSAAFASRIDGNLLPVLKESLNSYQEFTAGWQMEFSPERHLELSAAWTEETNGWLPDGLDPVAGNDWLRRTGLGAAWLTPAPLVRSLEVAGEYLRKTDRYTDEGHTGLLAWVELFPSPAWSLNLTADYEEESPARQDWMGSGELRMDFHYPASVAHTLTVFAGRLRGGQVCSNGNCRIVAPFDGVKVNLASTF